jgi:spermidine synthase
VIYASRNFYGVLRVCESENDYGTDEDDSKPELTHELLNGRIQHGFQFLKPELQATPTSYYGYTSGVGRALSVPSDQPRRVGLVGLGSGTLATYARPGDHFQFYEINAKVEEIARKYFTFLTNCKGTVEIIPGDARLNLSREDPQNFNLLVLDAFSGDAIPVHLLTREAFAIYLPHMAPDGIIAVHISNRHFALEPVVLALADEYHLATVTIDSHRTWTGEGSSTWVLVSTSPRPLKAKRIANGRRKTQSEGRVLWTDDHASLFEVWLADVDAWFARGIKKSQVHPGGVEIPVPKPEKTSDSKEKETDDK